MADALGFISGSSGAGGFRPTGVPTPKTEGPSFKEVLLDNIREVNQLQQDANRAIEDLAAGKRADVEGVILATQKADMAFRMLQQVRNKVVEAYDEIKQIRV